MAENEFWKQLEALERRVWNAEIESRTAIELIQILAKNLGFKSRGLEGALAIAEELARQEVGESAEKSPSG